MVVEIVGILGGLLAMVAFFQVSTGIWNGKSFWYEACNLVGSALLAWYAYQKHAYTNIVLNLVWGTIALYAIYHVIQRHKVRKINKSKKTKRRPKTTP